MLTDENDQRLKLIEMIRDAVARDNALREKYQIGDKFRFVRDRLQALLDQLERHQETKHAEEKKLEVVTAEDEILVYVYLYNTQGAALPTWINMLTPKLFYEYSVNRPIYTNRDHIDSLIRGKANRVQHAFLTVAVKEKDLIKNENPPKDMLGNVITKVREGALKFDRMVSLTHNETDYVLRDQVGLTKKI
jgi:hypothetical protein